MQSFLAELHGPALSVHAIRLVLAKIPNSAVMELQINRLTDIGPENANYSWIFSLQTVSKEAQCEQPKLSQNKAGQRRILGLVQ